MAISKKDELTIPAFIRFVAVAAIALAIVFIVSLDRNPSDAEVNRIIKDNLPSCEDGEILPQDSKRLIPVGCIVTGRGISISGSGQGPWHLEAGSEPESVTMVVVVKKPTWILATFPTTYHQQRINTLENDLKSEGRKIHKIYK